MDYVDYVAALRSQHPALTEEIAHFRTLESVLSWMRKRELPLASVEIITQDEYSHDFLIPLDASGEHLVFGTT